MPGFLGGSYEHRSKALVDNRCINVYTTLIETKEGKEPGALVACPGLKQFANSGVAGASRGQWSASDGFLYTVIGNRMYSVDVFGNMTQRGVIGTATGLVSMRDNGIELILVDGAAGYLYTFATSVFAAISDPDFPNGTPQIEFLGQRFIALDPGTQQIFVSDLLNGAAWDALAFGSAEGAPDDAKAIIANGGELFVFGDWTMEPFYLTEDATFPLARTQGGIREVGIEAVHSLVKLAGQLLWLAKTPDGDDVVMSMQGYQPQRVSTHAVETVIRSSADHHDAAAWAYEREGHYFYVLQMPDIAEAQVYDLSTGLWHERAGFAAGVFTSYPAVTHAGFASKNIVGHESDGKLYELDEETHTYAGGIRKCVRSWRPPYGEGKRVFYNQLRVDMETGVGLVLGQGSDPQVMLRYSDNGGNTWSNELWRSAGKIGEYKRRVQWNMLGSAFDRVFEIAATDPVKWVWTGAYGEMKVGR